MSHTSNENPAMKSRRICIVFFLAALLCSCQEASLPDELFGVWKTSAPKYADRYLEFTGDHEFILGVGEGRVLVHPITGVEKEQERGDLYTVFYVGDEGQDLSFAFYYDPGRGTIQWQNQRHIDWKKERR